MSEATKDRLARELHEAGLPEEMVERARRGAYDDWISDSATPLIDLVNELAKYDTPGARLVRAKVIDGDFDGTREESDAWAASEEGRAAFRSLLKPSS